MEYVTKTTNTVTMNSDSARLKHNHRDPETIQREIEKDPERNFGDISKDKVLYTLIDENHKTYESIVNDIFKKANDARNEAQIKMRHKDRCHRTYCSSWKADKKKKSDSPVMEIVVQVGGTYDPKKDYATGIVDPKIGADIMIDFLNQFRKKYPLLKVIDVTYHQGETTPHIHFDFVPIAKDEKYGITASLDKACEQMGFGEPSKKDPSKTAFHIKHFEHDFHELLDNICLQHGIEIDHPLLNRPHESLKVFKENEKLRQENVALKINNQFLEKENQKLKETIEDKKEELTNIGANITSSLRDLDLVQDEIKTNKNKSDEMAAILKEALDYKNELADKVVTLNSEIEKKEHYLKNMSAEQFASDLFITLSDKVNERFDQISFYPGQAEYHTFSTNNYKPYKKDTYIVPEKDLNRLIKNQYDFHALRKMIEDLFASIKSYIKKIFEQISQELINREEEVSRKEKEIEPAYEEATNLKYKYMRLIDNAETEIKNQSRDVAYAMIEDMFADPTHNTKGARAIAYLDKIGYLDDFERLERIKKQNALERDWD